MKKVARSAIETEAEEIVGANDKASPPHIIRDPLINLILRFSHGNFIRTFLLAFGIYGILCIGGGYLISWHYEKQGLQFISIFDPRELPLALYGYLLFYPSIWGIYAWQPQGILKVFQLVSQNGVIGQAKYGISIEELIAQKISNPFSKSLPLFAVAILTFIGFMIVTVTTSLNPASSFSLSLLQDRMWWVLNPFYFLTIWAPLQVINFYMAIWIVIRQAIAVKAFTSLFRSFEITPKLFHPDRCNGLAPVGDYAMHIAMVAVFVGFWLAFQVIFPLLLGRSINLITQNTAMLLVYLLVVPLLLVLPVWEAHLAMSHAKSRTLEALASQIREILFKTDIQLDAVEHLEKKYSLIDKRFRTWPFRMPAFLQFSAAAIAPLFSTFVSFLIDKFLKGP